jgi:hypothetical protein
MSGFGALSGRCRAGFRDAHSKQGGDIECRGVFRSVARLGSTDHTISSFSGKFRLWLVVVVAARQTASSVFGSTASGFSVLTVLLAVRRAQTRSNGAGTGGFPWPDDLRRCGA